MPFIPPENFVSKMNQLPPKLIRDWGEEIEKKYRLYEFRISMRGGSILQQEVDELLAMRLHKDYLYTEWMMDRLDKIKEDTERQKLIDRGYFQD